MGEEEVREVVDRERLLDAVLGHGSGGREDAGVVDQHVHPRVPRHDLVGRLSYLPLRAQVGGDGFLIFHSYFDGEADGSDDLTMPADGVLEDVLPILLRGWQGAFLPPGQKKSVPFLPSLLSSRLGHTRLAWGRAEIARGEFVTFEEIKRDLESDLLEKRTKKSKGVSTE